VMWIVVSPPVMQRNPVGERGGLADGLRSASTRTASRAQRLTQLYRTNCETRDARKWNRARGILS
jgi:hypothetical protein